MELAQLRVFMQVAAHLHVSKAARELHMAQPAVSRQIRELERACGGIALIQKVGRNVQLTEAGEVLFAHAQRIMAEVAVAQSAMQARVGAHAGRVRIGTPPTIGVRLLPRALAQFHQHHPAIELRIHQASTVQLVHQLDGGEIDLAVVTLPIPQRGHRIVALFDEPLVLVMHHQHPLCQKANLTLADFAEESFLLYPVGYEMHDVIMAACKQAGFAPKVAIDGGDVAMLLRVAEAGLGVAIVPQLALRGDEALFVSQLQQPRLSRQMALICRNDRTLPPPVHTLFHALQHDLVRHARELLG